MGYLKYLKNLWKKPSRDLTRSRLISWRKEPSTIRVDYPTRLDKARRLGYKAKQGLFVVRQKLPRSAKMRPVPGARRSKNARRKMVLDVNSQTVAEQRANKKYPNCEVINSYLVGKDGKNFWYEIILADKTNQSVLANKNLRYLVVDQRRAFRGKTSSSKKSRGLRKKGKGSEKARPSKAASYRRKMNNKKHTKRKNI